MACSSGVIGLKPKEASRSSRDSSDSGAASRTLYDGRGSGAEAGRIPAPDEGCGRDAVGLTLSKEIPPEGAAEGCTDGAGPEAVPRAMLSGAAAGATFGTEGSPALGMGMSLAAGVTVKPATLALFGSIFSA